MAWLVKRGETFHVAFRLGNNEFRKSLKTKNQRKAEASMHRLEDNLRDYELGRIDIPDGADIATYLLSDGRRTGKPKPKVTPQLGSIFDEYKNSMPEGALENSTLATIEIHMRHIFRFLGKSMVFDSLDEQKLQEYVTHRSKAKGRRGKSLSGKTIRKEVATLKTIWSFAQSRNYVTGELPNRRLRYPKTDAKEPFKTYAEIQRRIDRSNFSESQRAELWECLYLTLSETEELLDSVKENAAHAFLYPMVVAAAHTGARRSELVRAKIDDFDLENKLVMIRERKRNREMRTTRMVPMSSLLQDSLEDWFEQHPGGQLAFWPGNLNRGAMTGLDYFTVHQAHYHLLETLSGKWSVIRGWHTLRHSFASNLASEGVDQRIIDKWMGHQTAEMRQRYQHLIPDAQDSAMQSVFG